MEHSCAIALVCTAEERAEGIVVGSGRLSAWASMICQTVQHTGLQCLHYSPFGLANAHLRSRFPNLNPCRRQNVSAQESFSKRILPQFHSSAPPGLQQIRSPGQPRIRAGQRIGREEPAVNSACKEAHHRAGRQSFPVSTKFCPVPSLLVYARPMSRAKHRYLRPISTITVVPEYCLPFLHLSITLDTRLAVQPACS